jgi:23S rRNA (adenine2503-C2)-methyltransferase
MIERYTEERHPYRLILSLTSAFDEKRQEVMPVGRRYAVADLARAMRAHAARQGGIVNLAWVLMSGVNTQPEEAREIGRLFAGVKVRVSVIDVNDPTGRYARADDSERGTFLSALANHGVGFVRRYSGGPDIHAACGMLASTQNGGHSSTISEPDPGTPSRPGGRDLQPIEEQP